MSTLDSYCSVVGGVSPASWGQAQRNGAELQALIFAAQQKADALNQKHGPPKQELSTLSKSKPKGASMFTEVASDVKSFLLEHRSMIYFLALALIVDHLFFKDAFRHRLQGMVDKMVSKVEAKI